MLVDPEFFRPGLDPIREALLGMIGQGAARRRLRQGVYQIGHFSLGYEFARSRDEYAYKLDYPKLEKPDGEWFNAYGVCDNYEQVLEQCPAILTDPREFVMSVTEITKAGADPVGGWRWRKWGPYIGTQEPQCEYIYDEPLIERVFVYHIYQI